MTRRVLSPPRRHALATLVLLLFAIPAARAQLEQYTHLVVFGDSLSDTGNVATLTTQKYGVPIPGPIADYTLGRFTDGQDTIPAARNYFGVWIEQLAYMLPARPDVLNSLAGGTNYAYGFAFTGPGTTVLPLSSTPPISVTVNNINRQITTYLQTNPKIDAHTLFVVWGGANDVLNAKSSTDVTFAAYYELIGIERLIEAGATQFLIPNLPSLGAIPRLNRSPALSAAATQASILFNNSLALGLKFLPLINPQRQLQLRQLNIYTLFGNVTSTKENFYLTNTTDSAQGVPTANPDDYLFWDDLHPTTRGHNLIAYKALQTLEAPAPASTAAQAIIPSTSSSLNTLLQPVQ